MLNSMKNKSFGSFIPVGGGVFAKAFSTDLRQFCFNLSEIIRSTSVGRFCESYPSAVMLFSGEGAPVAFYPLIFGSDDELEDVMSDIYFLANARNAKYYISAELVHKNVRSCKEVALQVLAVSEGGGAEAILELKTDKKGKIRKVRQTPFHKISESDDPWGFGVLGIGLDVLDGAEFDSSDIDEAIELATSLDKEKDLVDVLVRRRYDIFSGKRPYWKDEMISDRFKEVTAAPAKEVGLDKKKLYKSLWD